MNDKDALQSILRRVVRFFGVLLLIVVAISAFVWAQSLVRV